MTDQTPTTESGIGTYVRASWRTGEERMTEPSTEELLEAVRERVEAGWHEVGCAMNADAESGGGFCCPPCRKYAANEALDPRWGAVRAGVRYHHEPSLQDTALAALVSLQTEHERYREALEAIEGDNEGREFLSNDRLGDQHQDIAGTALHPEGTKSAHVRLLR